MPISVPKVSWIGHEYSNKYGLYFYLSANERYVVRIDPETLRYKVDHQKYYRYTPDSSDLSRLWGDIRKHWHPKISVNDRLESYLPSAFSSLDKIKETLFNAAAEKIVENEESDKRAIKILKYGGAVALAGLFLLKACDGNAEAIQHNATIKELFIPEVSL